jgi:hypothetical protein
MPATCRHCQKALPPDCPADVTSCRLYADWRAGSRGGRLSEDEAQHLALYAQVCRLVVALRDGFEKWPELK